MLSLIFSSVHFSRNFTFADFFLPKYPFIPRTSFLSGIPRFIKVLSKMEYMSIIQNGGCFQFLFRNKLRHDTTTIVKGYLCVCQILDFIKHLTID